MGSKLPHLLMLGVVVLLVVIDDVQVTPPTDVGVVVLLVVVDGVQVTQPANVGAGTVTFAQFFMQSQLVLR